MIFSGKKDEYFNFEMIKINNKKETGTLQQNNLDFQQKMQRNMK